MSSKWYLPYPAIEEGAGQQSAGNTDPNHALGAVAANSRRSDSEIRRLDSELQFRLIRPRVSRWSRSAAKRIFDCACVIPFVPFLIPVFVAIAVAVRLTSPGPVLFLQKRMGRNGKSFTIVKFRTMMHCEDRSHNAVTTSVNQRFTPVGPILRRWKLDELPQLWNVLVGDMSLVGARPKLPEHQLSPLQCRPGITGAATLAFAREEAFLARLPENGLDDVYHGVILPAKMRLDQEYMARATFWTDFDLLLRTVCRQWDTAFLEELVEKAGAEGKSTGRRAVTAQLLMTVKAETLELVPDESLS